jgi:hypothetical protein
MKTRRGRRIGMGGLLSDRLGLYWVPQDEDTPTVASLITRLMRGSVSLMAGSFAVIDIWIRRDGRLESGPSMNMRDR